jgi:ubiquitin C-terminal hydrolase
MEDVEDDILVTLGGLFNLGNTCYLNSATQMWASLDSFLSALEASGISYFPRRSQIEITT